jgi:RimJ/RimL family protein N-acetyltransferase
VDRPASSGPGALGGAAPLVAQGELVPWELGPEPRVLENEQVVGLQTIAARDFAKLREVSTASWLGARFQRQGIGTEMRAAVLHLAFVGLNALEAVSGAFEDNVSSFTVSVKHGYALDGVERHVVRGQPATVRRLRLTRARWEMHQYVPVSIVGLSPCVPMFGLSDDSRAGLQEATS